MVSNDPINDYMQRHGCSLARKHELSIIVAERNEK
jgi:hypothetical protein